MKGSLKSRGAAVVSAIGAGLLLTGCQPSQEDLVARHTSTVEGFCTDCHNDIERVADMSLEQVDLAQVAENPALWEKVIVKLRGRLMPPPGGPRPDGEAVETFVSFLETNLDAAAELNPQPGRAGIHRLNRTEYGNAIRDLLALDIDPAEFLPADDEGYGFDNIADILRVSPSLLEQYLSASTKIAALAVGDPATPVRAGPRRHPFAQQHGYSCGSFPDVVESAPVGNGAKHGCRKETAAARHLPRPGPARGCRRQRNPVAAP